jgi:hypothetical protein
MAIKRTPSITRQALTREQAFKLAKWLEKNKKRITTENLSKDMVLEQAAGALGFPISANSLPAIAKDMGWTTLPWAKAKSGSQATNKHIRFLAGQILAIVSFLDETVEFDSNVPKPYWMLPENKKALRELALLP